MYISRCWPICLQYIIYGASTSVGFFGISLAKALGYRVLGVCSPHSFDVVKSYGADAVVDYHDQKKAIAEALDITNGGVEYALDAISDGDSFKIVIGMMGDKGKQLNCILGVPEEVYKINPKLKVEWTLMHTMWGVVSSSHSLFVQFIDDARRNLIGPHVLRNIRYGQSNPKTERLERKFSGKPLSWSPNTIFDLTQSWCEVVSKISRRGWRICRWVALQRQVLLSVAKLWVQNGKISGKKLVIKIAWAAEESLQRISYQRLCGRAGCDVVAEGKKWIVCFKFACDEEEHCPRTQNAVEWLSCTMMEWNPRTQQEPVGPWQTGLEKS